MREALKEVGRVMLGLLIGGLCCLVISLCSCRTVEKEVPVVVEHTTERHSVDVVRDTLMMRDSVCHFVKGDTVVIERWHHVVDVRQKVVTDTVRDTVPQVVTVREVTTKRVHDWRWTAGIVALLLGVVVWWEWKR